jgi:hypothetical protein
VPRQIVERIAQQRGAGEAGEAQRQHVAASGPQGLHDVRQRRLQAERHAGTTVQGQQRMCHQKTQRMLLAGNRGEQHQRALDARVGQLRQRPAQLLLHHLGEQMLLEDLQSAQAPQLTDALHQRRQTFGDIGAQSKTQQLGLQAFQQERRLVDEQRRQQGIDALAPTLGGFAWVGRASRAPAVLAQRLQAFLERVGRQRHHLTRPGPLVEQALDPAQPLHLFERVQALGLGVALGLRKAVTPLPHAQQILGQAGLAFNRGNAERRLDSFWCCLGQNCIQSGKVL